MPFAVVTVDLVEQISIAVPLQPFAMVSTVDTLAADVIDFISHALNLLAVVLQKKLHFSTLVVRRIS